MTQPPQSSTDQWPSRSRMPGYTPSPHGGMPVRWQDEQTGALPEAINAFLGCVLRRPGARLSYVQRELITDYLAYYVHAPCWDWCAQPSPPMAKRLATLRSRSRSKRAMTASEIRRFIRSCLEMGLDPL